ncbi:penicillin-binding protein 1A [Desulfovibrio ferrophilus]|uniref:Penicillin-binding protein 1A n=1 Tax=Desulfovibrio ferrophilus TaxID=241368 RepID=A0A2Z6AV00_9BACT|nr:PBP1A family penicillin-binding protein [Desulfovibrio ferrophilus]BBD07072.1 penicillin-binding protein [Desulfovibrio ferrophilus]
MKKVVIVLAALFGGGAILAAALVGGMYYWASLDLPDFKRITDYNPPLVTTVYARDNRVLGYFYKERRFLVTIDELPNHVSRVFLAAEDSGFYEHEGVDLLAIFRAFVKNLQAGHVVQGGSTITQQVIKSLLLTPERSYKRKIKEGILAYRLERFLTKDEILTIYLNQIFFGARAYGIESAARTYFGVHAKDLSVAQAALLAGLPKAPSKFNPFADPEKAISRQHYVLSRMLDQNWITQEQYDDALAEELVFKSMEDPSWHQGAYYLEEVRRRLIDHYGEDRVYNSGMHVYTGVDLTHQVAAERSVRKGLEASARRRGWTGPNSHLEEEQRETYLTENPFVVEALEPGEWIEVLVSEVEKDQALVRFGEFKGVIKAKDLSWARTPDPSKATEDVPPVKDCALVLKSGDVVWAEVKAVPPSVLNPGTKAPKGGPVWELALRRRPVVQGALVSIDPRSGEVLALVGGYSFAESQFNRATQAERQPGSAFKPIVYSTALDNGFTPSSVMLDAPIVYTDSETDKVWKPENFEGVFFGPTLLRNALCKSRNLVTIRVAQRLGVRKIIERAKALGLEADFPEDLSVSLGSAPVSPLNLAQAYTAFARGGSIVKPRIILKVESAWGDELEINEPEYSDAISPQTAYIIASLMKEVVRDGTGWRARVLKRPVAGKTGTSNDEQDAWFVGYSPYLLSVVYVGFDQLTPMGKYETGSRAASPLWVDYRMAVEAEYPIEDFPQPPGIVMARIDAASGLLAGPKSEKTYFLPFKDGTQPTETAQDGGGSGPNPSTSSKGEDLLKQIY